MYRLWRRCNCTVQGVVFMMFAWNVSVTQVLWWQKVKILEVMISMGLTPL